MMMEENKTLSRRFIELKKSYKNKRRKLQSELKQMSIQYELDKKELLALHKQSDKKHRKFLKLFNFNYLNSFEGKDNTQYDVFIWR